MFYIQFLTLQYLHEQYIFHFPMFQIKQVIYLSNCKKKDSVKKYIKKDQEKNNKKYKLFYLCNSSALLQIFLTQNSTNLTRCCFEYLGKSAIIQLIIVFACPVDKLAFPKLFNIYSISFRCFNWLSSESQNAWKRSSNIFVASNWQIMFSISCISCWNYFLSSNILILFKI